MFEWNVEDLKLLNQGSSIKEKIYNCESDVKREDKITFVDKMQDKFNKGHYAFYNKQISAKLDPNSDKKTVLERSWLSRGSKIVVAGIRRDDSFRPMIYKDTIYQHTVNKVQEIHLDGTLLLQSERTKVD